MSHLNKVYLGLGNGVTTGLSNPPRHRLSIPSPGTVLWCTDYIRADIYFLRVRGNQPVHAMLKLTVSRLTRVWLQRIRGFSFSWRSPFVKTVFKKITCKVVTLQLSLRPFHTWLRFITFCTVHTVHSVCSPFILLTTIANHIFSSVLAEPQYIY